LFVPWLRSFLGFVIQFLAFCAILAVAFGFGSNPPEAVHFSTDVAALLQRAKEVAPAAGSDVVFLEDEETYVFDAEGKVVHTRYYLYKVLTQKGAEEWAVISLSWEPWREERPTLRARVITADQAVHPLDANTITDAPAKESQENVFSDRRVLRAPLPAVATGAVVEEEVVSTEKAPFADAGTLQRVYFGGSVPVEHTRLVLDAPSTLLLRYTLQLLPELKPQRTEAEGRVRVVFESGPMDPLDDAEPQLPSDVPAYPSVTFSTGSSWQKIAGEYGKIVDLQIAGADLRPLVAKLISGKKSRVEKAAALLQYLHKEVRYTGVEFGEASVVPRSPTETMTRKYGDCKDKAALLVAMLRAADIPAHVALLNAGSREDVPPDLPGMGKFDHAIVYAPGSPDLWIDATDEYARLGEIPVDDQQRFALIARSGADALLRTPATSSMDNLLLEKREIYLAENGPARIVETSQPHGGSESFYRHHYADQQNKTAKEQLTNYMKGEYLAENLDRFDRSDPDDLSRQFELVLESNRARRGATDLAIAAAAIRYDGLFSRLPSNLQQREKEEDTKAAAASGKKPKKKRTDDYQLAEAFVTEWQYKIVPPAGFQPKALPQNAKLTLGPAILTEEFAAAKDGTVQATIRFDTVKRRMTVAEANEMRDQIVQLRQGEPIVIYFEPIGETLLSQGKVREALQSYRDLVALHPKEAVHHLQVAETLLAGGMGEAARAEAKTAVTLEPNSALAQKTLADILEYDLVGRKFRPGSDYAGAEAALRAAEKLDPDDKATVANLAVLLEHNSWGLRYGPGAKLREAIAEYRKLKPEKLAEFGMANNLAFALYYDGEFAEAQKNAQTLNPQPNALIVACEAALNGSQAAFTEARKRTAGEDAFKQVAAAAGQMLINLRKYPQGADLEEAGASGENASETAAFAALYRQTAPHEQLPFADDPKGVALRFELFTSDPNLTLDKLRSVCSRNGATQLATQERLDRFVKDEKETLTGKARAGQFPDVGLDLMFTRAQPKVQGNDTTGYKVTLWPSAKYKSARYVIKEDGHYKVLATSRYFAGIGLEVLDHIAANDLTGARTLLDWLREDEHLEGGDDPLAGAPFPHAWTRGKEADAAAMKVAAAAILVRSEETAARGISVLEAARASATGETEKLNIALALLDGYDTLDQYEKALAIASDLTKQYPESTYVFHFQAFLLHALGRFEEADKLAQERLRRLPDDTDALRVLIENAVAREDYQTAHDSYRKIVDQGKAEAGELNDLAWFSLFTRKVTALDLEYALKAAQLSEKAPGILHTLGCVYAEVGKTKEAREVLVQAMDALDLDQPDDNYWYAFGRIAEQYGERDVAISDYNRVTKPKKPIAIPGSSWRLAQLRLQALQSKKQ